MVFILNSIRMFTFSASCVNELISYTNSSEYFKFFFSFFLYKHMDARVVFLRLYLGFSPER